jgi:hypothetical protein
MLPAGWVQVACDGTFDKDERGCEVSSVISGDKLGTTSCGFWSAAGIVQQTLRSYSGRVEMGKDLTVIDIGDEVRLRSAPAAERLQ